MRFVLIVVLWITAVANGNAANIAMSADSLGLEVKGDTTYVLHQVDTKETLYGISKRYHSTVEEIVKHNPEVKKGLSVGVVIRVPYSVPQSGRTHQVGPGETMYSIAKFYNLKAAKIRSWNQLENNDLKIGQVLKLYHSSDDAKDPVAVDREIKAGYHQVTASETLYSIARKYQIEVAQLKQWNHLTSNDLKLGQQLLVQPLERVGIHPDQKPPTPSVVIATPTMRTPVEIDTKTVATTAETNVPSVTESAEITPEVKVKPGNGEMIKQQGLAAVIPGDYDSKKYLALHRTAPVGTIMQVKNEMSNLSVFVRVIGTLPDTGNNKDLILKISKTAQERLGALDDQFRVELSYVP